MSVVIRSSDGSPSTQRGRGRVGAGSRCSLIRAAPS
jgi:hypothetical protein